MTPNPVDWPQVLDDIAYLLGEGGPDDAQREPAGELTVARHLGFPRSTVRGWRDGSEPRHSDGEAVQLVWVRLTGKSLAFIPRARRPESAAKAR